LNNMYILQFQIFVNMSPPQAVVDVSFQNAVLDKLFKVANNLVFFAFLSKMIKRNNHVFDISNRIDNLNNKVS
jgi:hypothetical protein